MSPTDRCASCNSLTGWGLMAIDRHGKQTIPLCRRCCHCTKCQEPFLASELQETRKYENSPDGDKGHDLHLECEGCRAAYGFME